MTLSQRQSLALRVRFSLLFVAERLESGSSFARLSQRLFSGLVVVAAFVFVLFLFLFARPGGELWQRLGENFVLDATLCFADDAQQSAFCKSREQRRYRVLNRRLNGRVQSRSVATFD